MEGSAKQHAEKLVKYYGRLIEDHPQHPHWPICLDTAKKWLRLIDEPDPDGIDLLMEDLKRKGLGSGWIDMQIAVKAWRNKMRDISLEKATIEEKKQFAKILAEQIVAEEKEPPWLFVPSCTEYDRMVKYSNDDTCPKCKKGRVVLEVFHGNLGQNIWLKCKWGEPGCDFRECINDE